LLAVRLSNVPLRPPAADDITSGSKYGLHCAGERRTAAGDHIRARRGRWIDLHQIDRAGLESEIARDRHGAGRIARRKGAAARNGGGAQGARAGERAGRITISVPALIAVAPEYVFVPVSVSLPVPVLTSDPPVPSPMPPSRITPEKVVERLLPPTVRVSAPRRTLPPPSIDPGVVPPLVWSDNVEGTGTVKDKACGSAAGKGPNNRCTAAVGGDGGVAGRARMFEN
jgi:hypothetical protein